MESDTAWVWFKCQRAIELALGEFRLGARIRELAVGLLGDGLERTRIDDVEQIAGVHDGAVAKLDIGDGAADPGANLHFLDRLEPAGELIPVRHGALDRRRHRDRRRRRAAAACCGFSPQPFSVRPSSRISAGAPYA